MNGSLNDARTPREPNTEPSPQEHGAWNREHGTGKTPRPQAPSIVKAVDARRAELRRLTDAASPTPWVLQTEGNHWGTDVIWIDPCEPDGYAGTGVALSDSVEGACTDADAAFIVAARSAVPELLDALDRIEAVLADPDDTDIEAQVADLARFLGTRLGASTFRSRELAEMVVADGWRRVPQ